MSKPTNKPRRWTDERYPLGRDPIGTLRREAERLEGEGNLLMKSVPSVAMERFSEAAEVHKDMGDTEGVKKLSGLVIKACEAEIRDLPDMTRRQGPEAVAAQVDHVIGLARKRGAGPEIEAAATEARVRLLGEAWGAPVSMGRRGGATLRR